MCEGPLDLLKLHLVAKVQFYQLGILYFYQLGIELETFSANLNEICFKNLGLGILSKTDD